MDSSNLNQSNVEVKCRVLELDVYRARLARLGARLVQTLIQRDVYYKVQSGRKKLRIITGGPTELITYQRPDDAGVRTSSYHVHTVRAPLFCHLYHRLRYGIDVVVDKKRELWKWQSVRVHLDTVTRLGRFLELEAVVGQAGSRETAEEQCQEMIEALKISHDAFIGTSYADLIRG